MIPVNPLEQPRNQVHAEIIAAQHRHIERLGFNSARMWMLDMIRQQKEAKSNMQAQNRARAIERARAKSTKKVKRVKRKRRK